MSNGFSSTTNGTNIHEWGAAAPEILLVGIIRVHSSCNDGQALKFVVKNTTEYGAAKIGQTPKERPRRSPPRNQRGLLRTGGMKWTASFPPKRKDEG
jgi:hypothetical protein